MDQSLLSAAGNQISDTNTLLVQALDKLSAGDLDGVKTAIYAAAGSNSRAGLKVDAVARDVVAKVQAAPAEVVSGGGESWSEWAGSIQATQMTREQWQFVIATASDPAVGFGLWRGLIGGTAEVIKARQQDAANDMTHFSVDAFFKKYAGSSFLRAYQQAGGKMPA